MVRQTVWAVCLSQHILDKRFKPFAWFQLWSVKRFVWTNANGLPRNLPNRLSGQLFVQGVLYLKYYLKSSPISRVSSPRFLGLKSCFDVIIPVIEHCSDPKYNINQKNAWKATMITVIVLLNYFKSIWIPVLIVEFRFLTISNSNRL